MSDGENDAARLDRIAVALEEGDTGKAILLIADLLSRVSGIPVDPMTPEELAAVEKVLLEQAAKRAN